MQESSVPRISRAFILGAGLGTRLRPITEILPKPLIPFFHRPLIEDAMRRCYECGIREFIINTHHLAEEWRRFFPDGEWNGCPVHFSHEPVLLDSGGGLKQIRPWASATEPLLVLNGDTAATFDLSRLIEEHLRHRPLATLALRSDGAKCNVGFNPATGLITDMRHALGIDAGSYQFTGAYCVEPALFDLLPAEAIFSIIPTFLDCIRANQLRGITTDDGLWLDLGSAPAYLRSHRIFPPSAPRLHPQAQIAPDAQLSPDCIVGPGAEIGAGVKLTSCVVWPGVQVPARTCASHAIFYRNGSPLI